MMSDARCCNSKARDSMTEKAWNVVGCCLGGCHQSLTRLTGEQYFKKMLALVLILLCTLIITQKDARHVPTFMLSESPKERQDSLYSVTVPECRKQQKKYTYRQEQDLLNLPRPDFIPDLKNPCWKDLTNRLHCLPYMYIVGMAKCGTSDLFKRITLHPEFVAPTDKEPSWLSSRRFEESLSLLNYTDEYFSPVADEIKYIDDIDLRQVLITGEASVNTLEGSILWELYDPNVNKSEPVMNNAEYIYYLSPQTRILINVRNPIERLWSEYLAFSKDTEKSPEKFHAIVKEEIDLYTNCMAHRSLRSCMYDYTLAKYASMDPVARLQFMTCQKRYQRDMVFLRRGVYHVYINDYLKVFPREQVLIQRLEDISMDTKGVLRKTYNFLGMRSLDDKTLDKILDMGVRNSRTEEDISVGDMLPETRDMLWTFYHPHNRQLAELLGDEKFNYGPR